jgi:hypothetical protein
MSNEQTVLNKLGKSSLFRIARYAVVVSGCAAHTPGSAPQSQIQSAAGPTSVCTFTIPAADSPYGKQITGTIDGRFGGKLQADPIADKFNGQPMYQLGNDVYFDAGNIRTVPSVTTEEKQTNKAIFASIRQEAVAKGCDGVAAPVQAPTQPIKVLIQKVGGAPTAATTGPTKGP